MRQTNKVRVTLIIICIICAAMIFSRNVSVRLQSMKGAQSLPVAMGENRITHADAAKLLSALEYTGEELEALEQSHTYKDSKPDDWYDLYINGLENMGLADAFSSGKTTFEPMKEVTYGELEQLVDLIQKEKNVSLSKMTTSKNKDTPISAGDFTRVYEQLRKDVYLHKENGHTISYVKKKEVYVIGIPEKSKGSPKISTNQGQYNVNGIEAKNYIDRTLETYVTDDELLYIIGTSDKKATVHNAYIVEMKGREITAFINGVKRVFMAKSEVSEKIESVVADMVIADQEVEKITLKPEKIKAKVLSISDENIVLEKYGTVKLDKNFKVYQIYGELMAEASDSVLVGYANSEFVVTNGEICAALITDSLTAKNIRVLIRNNGYKGIYHNKVVLSADEEFVVSYGKEEKTYGPGERVTIKPGSKILKSGRLKAETKSGNGKIKICSLKRSKGTPSYRGSIEVVKKDGKLNIINEVSLEEYLYAVVPSEMPVSYGLEALKVQAICARSYAYNHLIANSCSKYGAHVDDSTAYQVYNNHGEDGLARQAVDETRGKVLQYGGKVIFAYYYSTSCGYTSAVNDVWMNTKKIPYLAGHYQSSDGKKEIKDFSSDKAFRKLLTENQDEMLDQDYPWYRWHVTISYKNLSRMVDSRLKEIYEKKSDYVETLGKDNKYHVVPVDSVGLVKSVKVVKRAMSGLATKIVIEGEKNTVRITSESFIRQILTPAYDTVVRKDGSKVKNLSLLPSSFIVLDSVEDGVTLNGGGYGHGVGMSQNGVKSLVKLGKKYDEILKHYYDGIEIGTIY